MLRVQRGRGVHYDHNDFRCRDSLQRSRVPPALRKHTFDAGESFFGVIAFDHCESGGGTAARLEHTMGAIEALFNFGQISARTYRFRATCSQITHVERFNAIAADECVTV